MDHTLNGEEILIYIEMNEYDSGILMLTPEDTLDDKVISLEAVADVYLIKPFEFRELSAILKELSRRSVKIIQINEFSMVFIVLIDFFKELFIKTHK